MALSYFPKQIVRATAFALCILAPVASLAAEAKPPAPPRIDTPARSYVVEDAGTGSNLAYARQGVLELGGFLSYATADDLTSFAFRPTAGWFFVDNLQLSLLPGVNYTKVRGTSTTIYSLLVEPSLHAPFTDTTFGFVGLGFGLASAGRGTNTGFAFSPRIGLNLLVGRSGILTPAFQATYSASSAVQTQQGTLLAVHTAYGFSMGYTVMW
jgi:hypothetical protein